MQTWTDVAQFQARTEGWHLADTIDNGEVHVYLRISPVDARFKNTYEAAAHVVEQARRGGKLHQQALQVSTMSRVRPTVRKKK